MPKVSVIIPTYNRSRLLRGALASVLNQSIADFEVLVVDDGSDDDTASVIQRISDKRVRYFRKDNGGLSSARNFGLTNCTGEYVALLDDDDLFPPDYLKTMVEQLDQKPEYGMAYSLFRDTYPDGKQADGFLRDRYMSGWLTKDFFGRMPTILPSATLYRTAVLAGFFFDEFLKDTEDLDFLVRLSARTPFLCVPQVSVTRRVMSDSMARIAADNLSPNVALILERFYFHLGGDKIVPARTAKRKISMMYRKLARKHCQLGHKQAAILLLRRAMAYHLFDRKHYKYLLKALLLGKKRDKMPHWQMPKPLSPVITVTLKS
ncbi:MAG TPA: glycosyltransferase family A protein [Sedimentisphaerales bacterium]|nr:glycosyltransferase family A protein [Sedimentisphaerales bacterium]